MPKLDRSHQCHQMTFNWALKVFALLGSVFPAVLANSLFSMFQLQLESSVAFSLSMCMYENSMWHR